MDISQELNENLNDLLNDERENDDDINELFDLFDTNSNLDNDKREDENSTQNSTSIQLGGEVPVEGLKSQKNLKSWIK